MPTDLQQQRRDALADFNHEVRTARALALENAADNDVSSIFNDCIQPRERGIRALSSLLQR